MTETNAMADLMLNNRTYILRIRVGTVGLGVRIHLNTAVWVAVAGRETSRSERNEPARRTLIKSFDPDIATAGNALEMDLQVLGIVPRNGQVGARYISTAQTRKGNGNGAGQTGHYITGSVLFHFGNAQRWRSRYFVQVFGRQEYIAFNDIPAVMRHNLCCAETEIFDLGQHFLADLLWLFFFFYIFLTGEEQQAEQYKSQ